MSKVLVIGGGAAGLLAAGTASLSGADVTVVDVNPKPARKVMITGKGRCNVTNNCSDIDSLMKNVVTNGRFLYSAFTSFMPSDTMALMESLGVKLKTERGDRVFPESDKASDIVDALKKYGLSNADYVVGRVYSLDIRNGKIVSAVTEDGREFSADKFILACGGKSYSRTGSRGDGYVLAQSAGHTVITPRPSLVPVVIKEKWCSQLQGLTLKNVRLSLYDKAKGKTVFSDMGEMLFTHFGISGPLVLSASCHMKKTADNYRINIDLKPALSEEQLDVRLLRDFSEHVNKDYINSLDKLLPKRLIPVIVSLSGTDAREKVNQISKKERKNLCRILKNIELTPESLCSIEEAIVTSGGVSTKEIDPKTMRSKIIENLYFAGEIIDVDAYTGGFNLQIAFSTGFAAGRACGKDI